MSDTLRNCSTPSPIYGFLCEQTNVFYAFETQEQYQEFLDWVQASAQPNALAPTDDMITEEELQYNFDRATENIMEVFEDPLFKTRDVQMELEEIDFWYKGLKDPLWSLYSIILATLLKEVFLEPIYLFYLNSTSSNTF